MIFLLCFGNASLKIQKQQVEMKLPTYVLLGLIKIFKQLEKYK